jgi:hypothetical protein
MRPRDKLQACFARNGIDRNPEAYILASRDVIIGLVLMPRRRLPRACQLGQHVVVVQPRRAAGHQLRGDTAQLRREQDVAIGRIVFPATEVLDEARWIVCPAGDDRARRRFGEVGVDAVGQPRYLSGGQRPFHQHRAVAGEGFCEVVHRPRQTRS